MFLDHLYEVTLFLQVLDHLINFDVVCIILTTLRFLVEHTPLGEMQCVLQIKGSAAQCRRLLNLGFRDLGIDLGVFQTTRVSTDWFSDETSKT